ncbi:MAG: hypothetical protein ACP5VS_06465 [Desulfomonilaceae bacterium]
MLLVGIGRLKKKRSEENLWIDNAPHPLIQVLIPITGVTDRSKELLHTLLVQDYPNYRVTFILEHEFDPAFDLVKEFCSSFGHVDFVLSGTASQSGQKNFALVQAISTLGPEVEIVVFCDSTNAAKPFWLRKITYPLRSGQFEVCSTFRSFSPDTINIPGVCQAIYASTVFALLTLIPKPWGGGTAILKKTFDRLQVAKVWASTVVDDLTLGNILSDAKVKIFISCENFLLSPMKKQTFRGLLAFLDRQILFPKFTNPGIWAFTVLWHVCLCLSMIVSTLGLLSYFSGFGTSEYALMGGTFWIAVLTLVGFVRTVNQSGIHVMKWLEGFPILILVATFVCVRSVCLGHIDWHGKRYYCGKNGLVTKIKGLNKH